MTPPRLVDPDIRVTPGTTRTAVATVTAPSAQHQPRRVQVLGDLYHGVIPDGAIYIGRAAPGLKASPYANQHKAGWCRRCGIEHDRASAVAAYDRDLDRQPELVERARRELAGKDLACWCKLGLTCHGDPLLRRVNGGRP